MTFTNPPQHADFSNIWPRFIHAAERFAVLTATLFGAQGLPILQGVGAHGGAVLAVLVGQLQESLAGLGARGRQRHRLEALAVPVLLGLDQLPHLQRDPVAPPVTNNTANTFIHCICSTLLGPADVTFKQGTELIPIPIFSGNRTGVPCFRAVFYFTPCSPVPSWWRWLIKFVLIHDLLLQLLLLPPQFIQFVTATEINGNLCFKNIHRVRGQHIPQGISYLKIATFREEFLHNTCFLLKK